MRLFRTILVFVFIPLLAGCFNLDTIDKAVIDTNKEVSEKAQEKVGEQVEKGKEQVKEYTKQQIANIAADLTNTAKEEIEIWLAENSLNQYGDPEGTMYTGGTPLFNEATGESRDRFEYVLEQHPELIERFDLNN